MKEEGLGSEWEKDCDLSQCPFKPKTKKLRRKRPSDDVLRERIKTKCLYIVYNDFCESPGNWKERDCAKALD